MKVLKRPTIIQIQEESNKYWKVLRWFMFHNRPLVETIFLVLYTSEQVVLIYATEKNGGTPETVGYFALVVLFTFSIHTPQIPPVCIEPLVENRVAVFVGVLKNHITCLSHATGVERGA